MGGITGRDSAADGDQLDPGGVQVELVVVVGGGGVVVAVLVGEEEGITVVHAELPLGAVGRRPEGGEGHS